MRGDFEKQIKGPLSWCHLDIRDITDDGQRLLKPVVEQLIDAGDGRAVIVLKSVADRVLSNTTWIRCRMSLQFLHCLDNRKGCGKVAKAPPSQCVDLRK